MPTPGALTRVLLGLAITVSACTSSDSTTSTSDGSTSPPLSTSTTPRECAPTPPEVVLDLPADPVDATLELTTVYYSCAPLLVVAAVDDDALAIGTELALSLNSPLLSIDQNRVADVVSEVDRLEPDRVIYVSDAANEVEVPAEWERHTSTAPAQAPLELFSLGSDAAGPTWVVSDELASTGVAVLATVSTLGGQVSLSSQPAGRNSTEVAAIGADSPTERWRLLAESNAPELPGGGITMFPGRRMVAFYGSPVTFRLGILGEQGPEATIEKLEILADEYALPGGDPVIPALELIATVADSKPGDDNDYSNELTSRDLQPWIDVAIDSDAFVILDLQPGRTDFLTQAKRYEDLLRLPNVGLALDPEWRLEGDQVHLQQIGSVDAEEINEVVAWLSQLVQEETLPQKLLVLHQFNLEMITNRELIKTPPELAVVVHVDGQGPLFSKYGTYDTVLEAPIGPDQTLWWGWKNFIDEDFPTATPGQVNAVDPLPVIVTYQ